MALINQLENLGDAVRERTGTEQLYTLEEMADTIRNLPAGGGTNFTPGPGLFLNEEGVLGVDVAAGLDFNRDGLLLTDARIIPFEDGVSVADELYRLNDAVNGVSVAQLWRGRNYRWDEEGRRLIADLEIVDSDLHNSIVNDQQLSEFKAVCAFGGPDWGREYGEIEAFYRTESDDQLLYERRLGRTVFTYMYVNLTDRAIIIMLDDEGVDQIGQQVDYLEVNIISNDGPIKYVDTDDTLYTEKHGDSLYIQVRRDFVEDMIDEKIAEAGGGGSVAVDGTTIVENRDGTISTAIGGGRVIDVPETEAFAYSDKVGMTNGRQANARIVLISCSDLDYVNPCESWDRNTVYNIEIEARHVNGSTHSNSGQIVYSSSTMWNAVTPIAMDGYNVTAVGYANGSSEIHGFYLVVDRDDVTYQNVYITKTVITKPPVYKYECIDSNYINVGEGLEINLTNGAIDSVLKGLSMAKGQTLVQTGNTLRSEDYNNCALIGSGNTLNSTYSSQGTMLIGSDNTVCGNRSTTVGYSNTVNSHLSTAFGFSNYTTNRYNHMFGEGLESGCSNQVLYGLYNIPDYANAYRVVIGNGPDTSNRANGLTIDTAGNIVAQGTISNAGADYAEYFEWADGNPDGEDRVGLLVTLDGNKIRLAHVGDDILGIVSGTATVLGDDAEWAWQGKYLRDDFGRLIMEEIQLFDNEGEVIGSTLTPKINPEYDATQEYISRAKRAEWDAIGMMGKLFLRDDGSCVVGGYATPVKDGIATFTTEKTNMKVMERISNNIIRVCLK